MSERWTLSELVAEAAARLEALPPPKNGQIRAVPDERTIRYYATLGLLDRPAAMRGRTALYDRKHLAQVVAIKRMQGAGHSLADIQQLWSTMDDVMLSRMSGVQVATKTRGSRKDFWKREADVSAQPAPLPMPPASAPLPAEGPVSISAAAPAATTTISVPLEGNVSIVIALADDAAISLAPADVRALRAAAAPLVAELAARGLLDRLVAPTRGTLEEEP